VLPRALASLLCLLGAAALGLGVASATVWRADDTLVATVEATTLVATEPGVLDLAAADVTVRAEAEGAVVIALGRTADVEAWIGTDAHAWVTGLVDRTTLSTRDVEATSPSPTATADPTATAGPAATPAPEPTAEATAEPTDGDAAGEATAAVADPTGSDLWVAEATGDGEAELEWSRQDGRWSVLVAAVGPDAGPVTLRLTWPQVVTTPWLAPGVAVGGLLLVAGLLWWVVLLWGTRWLGPVGALSRAGSARLLALLRHEEHEGEVRRPGTHPVPVVERARRATGEVERVARDTPAADRADGSPHGRPEVTDVVRPQSSAAVEAHPVPLPDDGAPLTRRQLRERAAAAAASGTARPASPASAADAPGPGPTTGSTADVSPTAPAAPTTDDATTAAPPVAVPKRHAVPPTAAAVTPAGRTPAGLTPAGLTPATPATAGATPAEPAPVAEPTPPAEPAPVAEPTPAARRRVSRVPSWLPGRRTSADVAEAPASVPDPVPEAPAPTVPATAPSASADAWRRAWGIPSIERTEAPTAPLESPDDGRSTDASEGEGR